MVTFPPCTFHPMSTSASSSTSRPMSPALVELAGTG